MEVITLASEPERGSTNTVTLDPCRLKNRPIAGLLAINSVLWSGTTELLIYRSDSENALAERSFLTDAG
jgi:hypothetical protein